MLYPIELRVHGDRYAAKMPNLTDEIGLCKGE